MTSIRKLCLGFIFILCCISGVACRPEPRVYRSLTPQEIQQFIADQNLTPVAVEHTQDGTLILFDNGQSRGYAAVSVDQDGKIVGNTLTASGGKKPSIKYQPTPDPSKVASVFSIGDECIGIIIHDTEIATRISSVEIIFKDGTQATVLTHGQRGVVVHDPAAIGWNIVILYTASGEEIYRETW